MKNYLLSLIVVICGCVQSRQPKIEFKLKEIDFGLINAGDSVNLYFPYKNTGNANLKILDMNSSCYFTVVKSKKNVTGPGLVDTLVVWFKSYKTESIGLQNSSIILKSNTTPQLTILHIKGIVKNDSLSELISSGKVKKRIRN